MHLAQLSGSQNRSSPASRTPSPSNGSKSGLWRRFKRGALNSLQAGLEASGLATLYVRVRQVSGAAILSYHSVAGDATAAWIDPHYRLDPRVFERRMKFLAARRRPISLNALVETLEAGREIPPRTVVVTLDDGYLDHATVAGPILAKLKIPATFFIPTGGATRAENQWIDRLYSAFQRRTRHELVLKDLPRFDLHRPPDVRRALGELQDAITAATYPDRCDLLATMEEQLRPSAAPPRLVMDWADIRALCKLSPDFEIGGHSQNHVDLGAMEEEDARAEIRGCAQDLRRELGEASRHFCYPYERSSPLSENLVRSEGFRCGVGPGPDLPATIHSDRFALPRIDPSSYGSFGFITSGAFPGLSNALTGRA